MPITEKKHKDIQLEIVEVLSNHKLDSLDAYLIIRDLSGSFKDYLKEEEDLDIDKLIKQTKQNKSGGKK